jgi:hypothetical protein
MRSLFMAAGLVVLGFSASLQTAAAETENILQADEAGISDSDSQQEERFGRWNQWVCYAWARGSYRPFTGVSQYFRPGSGMGQYAHSVAYSNALRQCQYYSGRRCISNFERDCHVLR